MLSLCLISMDVLCCVGLFWFVFRHFCFSEIRDLDSQVLAKFWYKNVHDRKVQDAKKRQNHNKSKVMSFDQRTNYFSARCLVNENFI